MHTKLKKAYSLIEVLVVVSVIGVLASVAYLFLGNVQQSARDQKLASDIKTLNRAVAAYVSSGGSLDDAEDTADVIGKLRNFAASGEADRMPGLSSSLIDPRLNFRAQSSGGTTGAKWNPGSQRFEVSTDPEGEFLEFFIDDNLAEVTGQEEDRESAMKYSSDSTWIWDYEDKVAAAPAGPTTVATVADPFTTTPAGGPAASAGPSTPSTPMTTNVLSPPSFSVSGGTHPIDDFPMSVSLADTNTPGLSQIKYQIDYGAWIDYTVPIAVTPGQIVSAQAISIDAGWLDSAKATQIYLSDSAQLAPPVILTSASNFGFFFNRTINVTLQNPNDPSYSELQFRIDGGAWTPYNGSFTLDRATYGGGVTIEAMAIASAGPYESYYQDSSTTAKLLGGVNVELTGTATGMFHDPTGLATMVTNLTGAAIAESSYFEWGDDTPIPGDPRPAKKSNLEFNGTGFSDLEEGTPFLIGDMDYFNGSIWADSGADTVNLGVDLNLNIGGLMLTPRFDFGLNLINTVNLETPGDPWPDADYVVIDNPTSSTQLFINDSIYEFSISFGETTPQGFALFDQFHVLEWKSANVKIYGSFTEVTP